MTRAEAIEMAVESLIMAASQFESHSGEDDNATICRAALAALRTCDDWRTIAELKGNDGDVMAGFWDGDNWTQCHCDGGDLALFPEYTHFLTLPAPPKVVMGTSPPAGPRRTNAD